MSQGTGNPSDQDLILAIHAGDESAFKDLYYRYADALFRFLWRRTGDRDTAEDLVQDLFIKVWQNRERLDGNRSIKAYLYQAANNIGIDHLRSKVKQGTSTELFEESAILQPNDKAFQQRVKIQKALADLPETQRHVFCLSRFEGLKYTEIGEVLNISVKTVETHMTRALKKLRTNLQQLLTWIFFGFLTS